MEKEVVLITGGTGLVGKVLAPLLIKNGFEVILLSRNAQGENIFLWDISKNFIDKNAIIKCDHIIHLAGEGIADKHWTAERKKAIIDSRVLSSELLIKSLKQNNKEIKTIIAASAVGYYGSETSQHIYRETDKPSTGFLSETCVEWEQATAGFAPYCDRLIQLRLGVVLDKNGGALKKIAQPINYYAGTVLGDGKQYMPWIDVNDLCQMILFCIQNQKVEGIYNAVASEHISNETFTQAIAKALGKSIILPHVPAFVIKMIFGELAVTVLEGSRVSNEKIKQAGFQFKSDTIEKSLTNLLGQ
jgi:hypothetical protein